MNRDNSHTDEDDIARMKRWGIELPDGLPAGRRWWDAPTIKFIRPDFSRKGPGCLLLVVLAALGVAQMIQIFGNQWWIWALFAVFLFLLPLVWQRSLLPQLATGHLTISENILHNRLVSWRRYSFLGFSVRQPPPFIPNMFRPDYLDWETFYPGQYQHIDLQRVDTEGECIIVRCKGTDKLNIPVQRLKIGAGAFCRILTYRIAKAKGENPPPPEFV